MDFLEIISSYQPLFMLAVTTISTALGVLGTFIYSIRKFKSMAIDTKTATEKQKDKEIAEFKEQYKNEFKSYIKEMTFSHDINPVVQSEMVAVKEIATQISKEQNAETNARLDQIVEVLEAQASYFDNSSFVATTSKEKLRNALTRANTKATTVKGSAVVEETAPVVVEEKKERVLNRRTR